MRAHAWVSFPKLHILIDSGFCIFVARLAFLLSNIEVFRTIRRRYHVNDRIVAIFSHLWDIFNFHTSKQLLPLFFSDESWAIHEASIYQKDHFVVFVVGFEILCSFICYLSKWVFERYLSSHQGLLELKALFVRELRWHDESTSFHQSCCSFRHHKNLHSKLCQWLS